MDMLDGVTVLRSDKVKDELIVDGNDIEFVARSAALINQVYHLSLSLAACVALILVNATCAYLCLFIYIYINSVYCIQFLTAWSLFGTEMPCEEQRHQEIPRRDLCQWEGHNSWRGLVGFQIFFSLIMKLVLIFLILLFSPRVGDVLFLVGILLLESFGFLL